MREQMEEHRANPACASCHKLMDPLGFALENFDARRRAGARATRGVPIDASAELVDGTQVDGAGRRCARRCCSGPRCSSAR